MIFLKGSAGFEHAGNRSDDLPGGNRQGEQGPGELGVQTPRNEAALYSRPAIHPSRGRHVRNDHEVSVRIRIKHAVHGGSLYLTIPD